MMISRRVSTLAFYSIVLAFVVMAVKFAAWWITGSVALFSDALESIVNVIASMIAWYALRVSARPPDDNHHYGHQKAEYFSAVVEGVLVCLAALAIFASAAHALMSEHTIVQPVLGMAVNAVAAVINGVWAYILISTGRRERSPALIADGKHIWTDVISSVGVLIGLVLVILTDLVILDALMAILVGGNVLYEGWKVIYASVGGLMDAALDPEEARLVEKTILENAMGAIEVHDIKTRVAGAVSYVEFHLVVDGTMSVEESHAICDRIEARINAVLRGAKTTIHVEPEIKRKASGLPIA